MGTRLYALGFVGQARMHQAKSSRGADRKATEGRKADLRQEADLALVRRLILW
jgi:hypothetical protein